MQYGRLSDAAYALRLERGEDIVAVIEDFCVRQTITNASLTGLGSIENPSLAHYRIDTKQFTERQFKGIFEVVSLIGNVGLAENQPHAHIHVTLSDADMQTHGGHLAGGACSATLELILQAYPSAFAKQFDPAIGLAVWDFHE